jgi:flagellin
VSITAQTGTFQTTDSSGNNESAPPAPTPSPPINGVLTVGNGLNLSLNTSSLDLNLTLSPAFGPKTTDFTITGGGARFQLGAEVNSSQQVTLGIQSVAASNLGNSTLGFLNDLVTGGSASLVSGQPEQASQIID